MRYSSDHKAQTRSKVLDIAARGFRRDGIDRLSVAGLMKEAGLTHGGFYAHFSSKDDLVKEAVRYAFTDAQRHLWAALEAADTGKKTLAVVESYLSAHHVRTPEIGCPLAAIGAEFARQPQEVQAAVSFGLSGLQKVLTEALAADSLSLRPELLISILVGAMTIARLNETSVGAEKWRKQVISSISPLLTERD